MFNLPTAERVVAEEKLTDLKYVKRVTQRQALAVLRRNYWRGVPQLTDMNDADQSVTDDEPSPERFV